MCVAGALASPTTHAAARVDAEPVAGVAQSVPPTSWLGASFQQDVLILPSSVAACSAGSAYECYDNAGTLQAKDAFFDSSELSNHIQGGASVGTQRLMLTYDHALNERVIAGARAGIAFGYGPIESKLPFHGELHLHYHFTSLAEVGNLKPFLGIAAGAAHVVSEQAVVVFNPTTLNDSGTAFRETELAAWHKAGRLFVAADLGLWVPLTRNFMLSISGHPMMLLPTFGFAIGLNAGITYGF